MEEKTAHNFFLIGAKLIISYVSVGIINNLVAIFLG